MIINHKQNQICSLNDMNNVVNHHSVQHAKKFLSVSPGLVDLLVGPVDFIRNLPDGRVTF